MTPRDAVPDPVLAEYAPFAAAVLTDGERWPTLTADGAERLRAVREHPHAPDWVHACGDRLDADDLRALARLEGDLRARDGDAGRVAGHADGATADPAWVTDLVARAVETVPRYRRAARERGARPSALADCAPVTRADLVRDLAGFVPLDVPLDRVLEGTSSGSTGAALVVPLHPRSTAADLVLLRHLLAGAGVTWAPDPDRLGLLSVVAQRAAFTYASVMSAFGQSAMARVNLHPSAWRAPGDREAFLADVRPQVVTTSPWPLLALGDLDVDLAPLAVVSGAAALSPAARERARQRWGAPVLDVYGLRETGPVAASTDGGPHRLVPRRVHVEVLDAAGAPVHDGVRGEVVVTVDENPYLPLLRYRTGDGAALARTPEGVVLVGLTGRAPVRLRAAGGEWVDAVSATQVLQGHGLAGWHLHQDAAGGVRLLALGGDAAAARRSLERLLGVPVGVDRGAAPSDLGPGGPRRCTTDLPGGR